MRFSHSLLQELFTKILKESHDERSILTFVKHLSWNNREGMNFFIGVVRTALEKATMPSHARQYLRVAQSFYLIQDDLILEREILPIEMLLEVMPLAAERKEKELLRLYGKWINEKRNNPRVKKWCGKHSKRVHAALVLVPPASPPMRRVKR
jgi:hypothetical protein